MIFVHGEYATGPGRARKLGAALGPHGPLALDTP
jgi:hypothetical protein